MVHLAPSFGQHLALVEPSASQFFSVEGNGDDGPPFDMKVVRWPLPSHCLSEVEAQGGANAVFELLDESRLESRGAVSQP